MQLRRFCKRGGLVLSQIIGLWMYTGLIFQGQPIAKPSPDLVIYFQFINETDNNLFYFRQDQRGYCERQATYSIDGNLLKQKITSANPDNADVCSADPDMQIGGLSSTRFEIKDEQLYLYLTLGEDELVYVWSKVN